MSKWFPEVDTNEGIKSALKGGFAGALVFAGMIALGMAVVMITGSYPGDRGPHGASFLIGMATEMAVVLVAAWRFKIGKGLIWGAVALLFFAIELIAKVAGGVGSFGWIFFYAVVGIGLVNGLRGAWARRTIPDETDYAEVFE